MTTDDPTKSGPADPLLGIPRVMVSLGDRSRSAVYAMLAAGELEAVKCGGRTMVRCSELERFIAALPKAKFGAAA